MYKRQLTGESVPRTIRVDDDIISGCVNVSSVIKMKATKEYDDSTAVSYTHLDVYKRQVVDLLKKNTQLLKNRFGRKCSGRKATALSVQVEMCIRDRSINVL